MAIPMIVNARGNARMVPCFIWSNACHEVAGEMLIDLSILGAESI
jgi:hypothetical protein